MLRHNALVLQFQQRYPEVEVELLFDDRFIDLVEERVDVAVPLGATLPPNVIARRIAVSPRMLVASPDYLAQHPRICQPVDLARHQILRFSWLAAGDDIVLDGPGGQALVSTPCRYRVNNSVAMRKSFLAGTGFGLTPAWLVQDLLDSDALRACCRAGAARRRMPSWCIRRGATSQHGCGCCSTTLGRRSQLAGLHGCVKRAAGAVSATAPAPPTVSAAAPAAYWPVPSATARKRPSC